MREISKRARMMLSLPPHEKAFVEELATENCTSANAEIVRAIRERRERMEVERA